MSLKAKLEAVIYAAEEPVTLAQLASLFAADALEWKAEKEAAAVALTEHSPDEPGEPLPLITDELGYPEPDQADSDATNPGETDAGAQPEPAAEHDVEAVHSPAGSQALVGFQAPVEESLPAQVPEVAADAIPDPPDAVDTDPETAESTPVTAAEPTSEPDTESGTEPAQATEPTESDAKREARQRDREVRAILRELLDELIAACAADDRGIEIREIAGGYRMATKPECHDAVRLFVKSLKPALKLSLPALETLAVIAYKQPVTAPEVNEIRGVDSSGVFGSLLARKLIATAGRKQVIGRPILYKTTREFLLRFGLKDVAELPSMEEFEKMAAIELEESESAGTEAATQEAGQQESSEQEPAEQESAEQEFFAPAPTDKVEAASETGITGEEAITHETAPEASQESTPEPATASNEEANDESSAEPDSSVSDSSAASAGEAEPGSSQASAASIPSGDAPPAPPVTAE